MKDLPAGERKGIVEHHIDMRVGYAADKPPAQPPVMNNGKRFVPADSPKLLLLDEPLWPGCSDASNLQKEQLMKICEREPSQQASSWLPTMWMKLFDRIVMFTNGPESKIGRFCIDIPLTPQAHGGGRAS